MPTESQSIYSIGQASALIQFMPGRIRAAAEELGISPTITINAIPHYDEADVARIAEHLHEKEQKK